MGNKHGKSNTYVVSGSGRAGHSGYTGHRTAEDRGRRHSGQSDTSVTPSDDINYSGVDPSSTMVTAACPAKYCHREHSL